MRGSARSPSEVCQFIKEPKTSPHRAVRNKQSQETSQIHETCRFTYTLAIVVYFFAVWRTQLIDNELKLILHFTCREKAGSLYLENQRKNTLRQFSFLQYYLIFLR